MTTTMSSVLNCSSPIFLEEQTNSGDILQSSGKKTFLADSAASVSSIHEESSTSDDYESDDDYNESEGRKPLFNRS
jgi:hypothetical protein